eukprot:UN24561
MFCETLLKTLLGCPFGGTCWQPVLLYLRGFSLTHVLFLTFYLVNLRGVRQCFSLLIVMFINGEKRCPTARQLSAYKVTSLLAEIKGCLHMLVFPNITILVIIFISIHVSRGIVSILVDNILIKIEHCTCHETIYGLSFMPFWKCEMLNHIILKDTARSQCGAERLCFHSPLFFYCNYFCVYFLSDPRSTLPSVLIQHVQPSVL